MSCHLAVYTFSDRQPLRQTGKPQKRPQNTTKETKRNETMNQNDNSIDDGRDDISTESISSTVTSIMTPMALMKKGLQLGGYSNRRIGKTRQERNIERFKSLYGASPFVVAMIWEDLQTTSVNEAFVPPEYRKEKYFLMALHHLKRYPTDIEREAKFDINIDWSRRWVWYFVEKVQALKQEKIKWPDDNFSSDVWAITIDGTHCWIEEPSHPEFSQDKKYFSHKYGSAGLNYELGISIRDSHLVWMNGPFPSGLNDVTVFKKKGLKQFLRQQGKMAIGDQGYAGHPYQVSTFNIQDSRNCKKFKSRALKRHERFNGYTKSFDCLSARFRHGEARFKNCFEAVCVVCQYIIELDNPLYTVLIDELMEDDDA